jgi:hypothetical protein
VYLNLDNFCHPVIITAMLIILSRYLGEEPSVGGTQAHILSGSLYNGSLTKTSEKKEIRKLLAPVVPTNIFCIGLNYMKHYEESAAKRGVPLPSKPVIFMKPTTALANPGDDVSCQFVFLMEQLYKLTTLKNLHTHTHTHTLTSFTDLDAAN